MKKINKGKFETRTVEIKKTVYLDEDGNEDRRTFKGALFNQPIMGIGLIIAFILSPLLGVVGVHGILTGIVFIIGCLIAAYGERHKL
jgi:hypothetical protein